MRLLMFYQIFFTPQIIISNKNGINELPHHSTALTSESFLEKTWKKKHLHGHDKNYYYFWKSIIPVISLIVGSRNMINVSKYMSL